MSALQYVTLIGVPITVLVSGLIFRANVWAIRGNDETPDDGLTVAEVGDA